MGYIGLFSTIVLALLAKDYVKKLMSMPLKYSYKVVYGQRHHFFNFYIKNGWILKRRKKANKVKIHLFSRKIANKKKLFNLFRDGYGLISYDGKYYLSNGIHNTKGLNKAASPSLPKSEIFCISYFEVGKHYFELTQNEYDALLANFSVEKKEFSSASNNRLELIITRWYFNTFDSIYLSDKIEVAFIKKD